MGLYDFSALRQILATQVPAMQQKSWWPSYVQAQQSGDPNQVIAWATYQAPQFADFDGATDGDFVGKQVASMQSGQADRYGINPNVYESAGKVGGTLGALGLAASLGYAGAVGLGAAGAGAGAAEGVGAAGADTVAGGVGTNALAGGAEGAAGGAAGGTGLSAGTGAATGIGGGAAGTGLALEGVAGTGTGAGAAGITGGASGSLAPGHFAGETLYPVVGGGASAAGAAGLAGGSGTAAGSGGATAAGLGTAASILGRIAPAALGAFGASRQAGALQGLANQYAQYGEPSRARYEQSMTPGFDPSTIPGYSGAVDTASKSVLAKLSANGGNPFGNPGGLIDAQKQVISGTALPAVQEYQRLNAGTGFGTTLNAAGGFGQNAIGAQGNIYNAVGAGINDAINPPQTLAQQLADLKKAGLFTNNSLA